MHPTDLPRPARPIHKIAGLLALGLAALAAAAAPAMAQDPARMDQVVRASADTDAFSGSVLVARDGEILLDQGYGLANREWNIPNAGDTKFRLGSVTKQFTAVAIMLLAERGLVDVDAPVKTYLPDAPAAWDGVTVKHLLTHTSGIPDFTRFEDFEALNTLPTTVEGLIGRFRDRPLAFQPGERFAYSNSGYVVLTAIIEKASGQTYAEFATANLFQPLGMADTSYDTHSAILPRRASGYTPSDDGVVNADYADMTVPQGAGGLYSTTRDLLKWEQGLFGGKVLKADSLTRLTTPYRGDYAMGLGVGTADGHRIISHSGGIQGFNTYLGYDADARMTVVVLGNLNGDASDKIGADLMTLARGGTVRLANERQEVAVSAEALAAYAGTYEATPSFGFTVSAADGKLTAQATGQQPLELFAEGPDAFFLKVVDARITFTRDAAGVVDGLVLHQGGRELPAKKK